MNSVVMVPLAEIFDPWVRRDRGQLGLQSSSVGEVAVGGSCTSQAWTDQLANLGTGLRPDLVKG